MKASEPISLRDRGSVMLAKLLQLRKSFEEMDLMLGRLMLRRLEQSSKALEPMSLMELGNFNVSRLAHPLKASWAMPLILTP